jgi:hypothetical protein
VALPYIKTENAQVVWSATDEYNQEIYIVKVRIYSAYRDLNFSWRVTLLPQSIIPLDSPRICPFDEK